MTQKAPFWANDLLQGYITSLSASVRDEETQHLVIDEAIKMMPDILDATTRSGSLYAQPDILEDVIAFLNLVNSLGKKVKNKFRVSLLGDFLKLISQKSVTLQYRLEISKGINNLLENFGVSFLQNLLSNDDFLNTLGSLLKTLIEAGDYEFQVCLIECFNRVVPKPDRADILRKTDQSNFLKELLLSVRVNGGHFDADCRAVLNKLNEQNSSALSRVYSFPAESVKIDGKEIYKPLDDEYEKFWIDLNTGSGRISLFIEPNFPQSQEGESEWDIVSLWKNDVVRCDCKTSGKFWRADIELKSGAQIYGSKDCDDRKHLIAIRVATDYPFQEALSEALGDSCVNFPKQQKLCHASSPLSISIKSPPPTSKSFQGNCKNNPRQDKSLQNPSHKLPSNDLSQSSHHSRCNAKASVPLEPMSTPARSWISCSSQESSWSKIHEQTKKISAELDRDAAHENEKFENLTHISGKDQEQSESLKTKKCSVPASIVAKQNTLTSPNNKKRSSSSDQPLKASKKTVKDLSNSTTDENTINDKKKQSKATSKSFELSEISYPIVSQDDDNSCPLRRSQRKINKIEGEKLTKEKKHTDSNDKKTEKKLTQRATSCKKQLEQKIPADTDNFSRKFDRNTENSVQVDTLRSRESKTPPPPKNIKSHKKVKTPVVTVQEPRKTPDSKSGRKVSNTKQDSAALSRFSSESDARLEEAKNSKDQPHHNYELVQEPTISSVYEEKKRKASKHMNATAPGCIQSQLLNKNIISPGFISEEDFKRPHLPFRCNNSKKDDKKNKREKKDLKKKTMDTITKRKSVSTSDEVHNNYDFHIHSRRNIGEQNASKEQSITEEVLDYSNTEKQSDQHERFSASHAEMSPKDSCSEKKDLSKSAQASHTLETEQLVKETQSEGNKVSEDNMSDNHLCRSKKKSKFQPPSKALDDLRKQKQVINEKDTLKTGVLLSQSKSGIHEDDSLKTFYHQKQRESDKDPSKFYDSTETTSETCKGKTNANDDVGCRNSLQKSKSKENIHHFQQGTANLDCLKNGQVAGELMKSNSCDDVSSSNSGYLFVETGSSSNDLECNMIDETQCDSATQQFENVENSADIPDVIRSSGANAPPEPNEPEGSKTNCSNGRGKKKNIKALRNIPENFVFDNNELDASGDYNPQSTEPEICSNMESSYVFNKYSLKTNHSNAKPQDFCTKKSTVGKHVLKEIEPQQLSTESVQEKNRDNVVTLSSPASQQPDDGGGDGLKVSDSPDDNRPGRLLRQLRERNKKISYKEWESFDQNLDVINTPKIPVSAKPLNVEQKRKLQKDQSNKSISRTVSQKNIHKEEVRQKKTIWTSREIKTTVTTKSYSKMIDNSCSSDPYNFEADCATTSTEAAPLVPFRLFSMDNTITSLPASAEKQAIQNDKKAVQKTKTHQREFQKESSRKMEMAFGKVSTSQSSHINKKGHSSKSQSMQDKRKKKAKEAVDFKYTSSQTDLQSKKKAQRKIKSSMEFSLFSSQKSQLEASNTDSGLVFPPLEDSIPCTPYDEIASVASNDGLENSPKQAAISECSWMKSKTPVAEQAKMRGKTYNKAKWCQLEHQAETNQSEVEDEIEQGPLYQRLHYKQHQEQQLGTNTPMSKKEKEFGRRSREWSDSAKDKFVSNLKAKKTVPSILTNSSTRSKDNSTKKTKRSLSFKSPSDHEKSNDSDNSDHEGEMTVSPVILDCSSEGDQCLDIPILNMAENILSSKRSSWKDLTNSKVTSPWKAQASNQELDKFDPSKICLNATNAIYSGPVSTKRPRRSALKRKYMGQYTSSSDREDISESESNQVESISIPKKLFLMGSSSGRIKELRYDKFTTPRTPKNKLFSNLLFNDTSPTIPKLVAPERKSAPKKASQKLQAANTLSPKKKRKSQRKLNLTPALFNENKPNFQVSSFPSFDLHSGYTSSPERMRDCSKLDKEPCLSPVTPLSVAMEDSPVIELSHLDSPEVGDNIDTQDLESPPCPTALLDTIKDDLNKPLMPEQSEGSSQDCWTQMISHSESSKSETNMWSVMQGSHAGLRDFVTRKNMATAPLPLTQLADSTQQTMMCISSKWKDEQRERVNAVKKFQHTTDNILTCMGRDIKGIAECEKAATTLWEQQVEKLRRHRHAQEKEMLRLKKAHDELKERLQESAANKKAFRDIRATLNKDVESFRKKLEDKYMEHSLTVMKRCLETSFMFS